MSIHPEDQPSEPPGLDAIQLANYERVAIFNAVTRRIRQELASQIAAGEQELFNLEAMTSSQDRGTIARSAVSRAAGKVDGLRLAWEIVTGEPW